jgi:WS/DGAT/MGAT family acyltransferase
MIERLRLGDLANLWAESPGMPSQIAVLAELDASPFVVAGRLDGERVGAELARRVRRVPALARRVVWTRLGQGRPAWATDPGFDPTRHITCTRLPSGEDLARWCADRVVRPLDRDRPLWRAEIVDGLPAGRFGLLVVMHHALADGLTGVAIAAALLDPEPDTEPTDPLAGPLPAVPTGWDLVTDNLRARRSGLSAALRRAAGVPRTLRRWGTGAGAGRTSLRQLRDAASDVRATAPRTSLPRRVGPGRRLAVVRLPLDKLRTAAHADGATINDLLLAAVCAGLRDLLRGRGDRVAGLVLRASFPVGELAGQHAGMLLVGLPVSEPDPLLRLRTITTATTAMKARVRAGGGDVFDVLRLPGPLARLAVTGMRRIARRHINLFVTNVPGPTRPLWLAGARLLDAVPVAPLTADVPLGVAALSYVDTLAVSVNADAAVTDLDVLARGIEHGFAELEPAVGR